MKPLNLNLVLHYLVSPQETVRDINENYLKLINHYKTWL